MASCKVSGGPKQRRTSDGFGGAEPRVRAAAGGWKETERPSAVGRCEATMSRINNYFRLNTLFKLYNELPPFRHSPSLPVGCCSCCQRSPRPLCKDCVSALRSRLETGLHPRDIAAVLNLNPPSAPSAALPLRRAGGRGDSDEEDEPGFLDFDGSFEGGNLGVAQVCSLRFG